MSVNKKENIAGWWQPCIMVVLAFVIVQLGADNVYAAEALSGADLYSITPEPLTVAQCGQCHVKHFSLLKEDGRKHRFECQKCHEVFHAYNPVRGNWAELMPKCNKCHTQPPHGEKFVDCLVCHANPHTPRRVAMGEILTGSCGQCHTGPAGQLTKFPSAHTEQGCAACHTKHGLIPSCMECHEPHVSGQGLESCKACHPVHKPLQVVLAPDSPSDTCGACHGEVYGKWAGTRSKHRNVNCSMCHEAHGRVPHCTKCHATPHDRSILMKFPRCLECHMDVHDLPVKQ